MSDAEGDVRAAASKQAGILQGPNGFEKEIWNQFADGP